jgi:hypothetical protein
MDIMNVLKSINMPKGGQMPEKKGRFEAVNRELDPRVSLSEVAMCRIYERCDPSYSFR